MTSRRRAPAVLLAQPRGSCAGVVRAIEVVERALAWPGAPGCVSHEIVHNAHVAAGLRARGAVFVDELADVPERRGGAVTVFSAHGVSTAVEAEAQARQLDAATPPADVTQTTLSLDDTRELIAALQRRFVHLVGPHTDDICYATQNRPHAVLALAVRVELVRVVGAPNSSNAARLREVAARAGVVAHPVQDETELDRAWLAGVRRIGVSAGARARRRGRAGRLPPAGGLAAASGMSGRNRFSACGGIRGIRGPAGQPPCRA
ncbi:MAG: hypothetical protein AB9M60_20000 [Leptothrix sp. (in: b-proteobacteria)]